MRRTKSVALAPYQTILLVSAASAKAPTAQLSIAVPGLPTPIHTSERAATKHGLWGESFANFDPAKVREPAADALRYTVYFWVDIRGAPTIMYVIDYLPAFENRDALVCLQGPKDKWYRTNTSSIVRDGFDGHCFDANKDWSQAIDRVVAANSPD